MSHKRLGGLCGLKVTTQVEEAVGSFTRVNVKLCRELYLQEEVLHLASPKLFLVVVEVDSNHENLEKNI